MFFICEKQTGYHKQFTLKERDIETGLDYFGARYYASTQGRFTSTDPSGKSIKTTNPQTWNRNSYTLNNPLRYVDENGKWPTDTHNRIIEKAFRTLDPKLVRHIQRGSESVDRLGASPRTLYEKNAAQHAMTPGYKVRELGLDKAKDWARNEATNFINTNMSQAKDLYEKSNQTNSEASKLILTVGAFESFGKGAHTIMDGASPAHRDFQVYDTQGYKLLGLISPVAYCSSLFWPFWLWRTHSRPLLCLNGKSEWSMKQETRSLEPGLFSSGIIIPWASVGAKRSGLTKTDMSYFPNARPRAACYIESCARAGRL